MLGGFSVSVSKHRKNHHSVHACMQTCVFTVANRISGQNWVTLISTRRMDTVVMALVKAPVLCARAHKSGRRAVNKSRTIFFCIEKWYIHLFAIFECILMAFAIAWKSIFALYNGNIEYYQHVCVCVCMWSPVHIFAVMVWSGRDVAVKRIVFRIDFPVLFSKCVCPIAQLNSKSNGTTIYQHFPSEWNTKTGNKITFFLSPYPISLSLSARHCCCEASLHSPR